MSAAPEDGDLLTGAIGGSGPRRCEDGLHPVDESHDKEEADETAFGPADARLFRGVATRLNYMGHDRPHMQYAIKEAARCMASPRECDWALLKKIGKYLLYRPRVVMKYPATAEVHRRLHGQLLGRMHQVAKVRVGSGHQAWGAHD